MQEYHGFGAVDDLSLSHEQIVIFAVAMSPVNSPYDTDSIIVGAMQGSGRWMGMCVIV